MNKIAVIPHQADALKIMAFRNSILEGRNLAASYPLWAFPAPESAEFPLGSEGIFSGKVIKFSLEGLRAEGSSLFIPGTISFAEGGLLRVRMELAFAREPLDPAEFRLALPLEELKVFRLAETQWPASGVWRVKRQRWVKIRD